ncbi:hypothetical protein EDC96DRAFT_581674 [Choanephora cucurbitarum]|nr:hypothetical protein EDC96DRAFT_581674 [Choanephora cucurbitarum]
MFYRCIKRPPVNKNVNEDGQQANNQQQLSPSTQEQVAEVGQPYYMSYNHADSDQDIQLDQDLLGYVDDDDAGKGPSYMPRPKRRRTDVDE